MHRPARALCHISRPSCFSCRPAPGRRGPILSGAGPAIAEVANGVVQWMFPSLFTAQPYLRSGKLKALAMAGTARLPAWPDIPTMLEAGVSGVEMTQWYGLFAPARTPATVVRKLITALYRVLQTLGCAPGRRGRTGPDLVAKPTARWADGRRRALAGGRVAGRSEAVAADGVIDVLCKWHSLMPSRLDARRGCCIGSQLLGAASNSQFRPVPARGDSPLSRIPSRSTQTGGGTM